MIHKRTKFIVSSLFLIIVIFIRSFENFTPWEWLGSFGLVALAIHLCYGGYELHIRHANRKLFDKIMDVTIYLTLLIAIIVFPDMRLTNGILAVMFYLIATRYWLLVRKTKGLQRRFFILKLTNEAPLTILFAAFSIGGFLSPALFGPAAQGLLIFLVNVIGSLALILFAKPYQLPRDG